MEYDLLKDQVEKSLDKTDFGSLFKFVHSVDLEKNKDIFSLPVRHAIQFRANDLTVLAESKKPMNLYFNFRKYIFSVLGTGAGFISGEPFTCVLTAVALWGIINEGQKVPLNESHAKVLMKIYRLSQEDSGIKEDKFWNITNELGISRDQLTSISQDLIKLKIIRANLDLDFKIDLMETIVSK